MVVFVKDFSLPTNRRSLLLFILEFTGVAGVGRLTSNVLQYARLVWNIGFSDLFIVVIRLSEKTLGYPAFLIEFCHPSFKNIIGYRRSTNCVFTQYACLSTAL